MYTKELIFELAHVDTDEDKEKYIKDFITNNIFKTIKEIEAKSISTLDEMYIKTIHYGEGFVGDAYYGGGYQAIDAEEPKYFSIILSTKNWDLLVQIRTAFLTQSFDELAESLGIYIENVYLDNY